MGSSPPPPDPRIGEAALQQAEIAARAQEFSETNAADQLAFAERAFDSQMALSSEALAASKEYAEGQLSLGQDYMSFMKSQADITNGWAKQDRDRYYNTFVPMQDDWIAEAKSYDTPGRKAQAADEAAADVSQQFALGRQQNERQMAAMGVAPNSGRYQSSSNRMQATESLAGAGARNSARRQTENTARDMKLAAINMGQGLAVNPGTSMGLSNSAAGAGFGGAMQGQGNAANIGMSGFGTAGNLLTGANSGMAGAIGNAGQTRMQGYGTAAAGQGNMANTLNTQYQNQMNAWQASQAQLGSIAGGIGAGLGYLAFSSSKDYKTEKRKPMSVLNAVRDMPVEEWEYKQGMGDGGGKKHIGPYAEDFQKSTGLGNGKEIGVMDAIGVTMGAVQELAAKVDKLEAPRRTATA